jgi:hypothetical protein
MSMMETKRDTARPWRIASIVFAFLAFGFWALAAVSVVSGVVAGLKGDKHGWAWAVVAVVLAAVGVAVRSVV